MSLDTMSSEDTALMNQMRADDAASTPAAETPAPETAVPDPQPQAQAQPDTPDRRDGLQGALDKERGKRKEIEQKFQELQTRTAADQARLQERLDLLVKAAEQHVAQPAPQPVVEEPIPDFQTDPGGFIKHGFERLQRQFEERLGQVADRVGKVETGTTQLTQHQQQQQTAQALMNWGQAQERAFAVENPDYNQAMAHLMNVRRASLELIGMTPEQIQGGITQEVLGLAHMAQQKGMNFAETLYKMAQAQGYRKAAPDASAVAPGDVAPAVAPVAAPIPAPANAAERLIRGNEMATTIGATGAAPRGDLTVDALSRMSDSEFAAHYAKIQKDPGALRAMFGA